MRARRTATAYAFLAPTLIVVGVFMVWPMLQSLADSFYDKSIGPGIFVGLGNYTKLLGDPAFLIALRNTVFYAVAATPVAVALALGLALLLNGHVRGRGFFRSALFLPSVVSLGVVAIAWKFLLDPDIGLVTYWLRGLGVDVGDGVRDADVAMWYLIGVGVWKNAGFYMVMYLAGLQTIPRMYYEAATIDGAGPWQRFRKVTWPLLGHTTMFVFIIAAIAALQVFDQIFVMTRGGPHFATESLVYLVYRKGLQDFEFGYASAIAWVLVLIVFVLSLAQNVFFSRRAVRF
ncbi:carbohydrate ABC transporter permease [Nonomuraea endophytica]|uniref:ABC-type sugar transport system permease subunit n=1 Tax=Nonomuraea endophytica TaxID=714136 RepID=A0A7W8EH62_9ACTN|nr:sugar ABC transporter permease [Nonomuraea endophytica]MBB5079269.1 ABC-type sugar transport system permease subunit [Nonomuraea endophytica]